jgi:hypothetical protein
MPNTISRGEERKEREKKVLSATNCATNDHCVALKGRGNNDSFNDTLSTIRKHNTHRL